jgi:hypothetical protein
MAASPRSQLPAEFNDLIDQLGVQFFEKPFDIDEVLDATCDAAVK